MKDTGRTISVFFHNYYGNDAYWRSFFANRFQAPYYVFYNYVADAYGRFGGTNGLRTLPEEQTPSHLINVFTTASSNKGKDIGGKLVSMDAYLRMGIQSDYILLLHDKHSPYHANSVKWKQDLFRIAEPECQQQAFEIFEKDSKAGIIASANAIRDERDNEQQRNAYIDSDFVGKLKKDYDIDPSRYDYVAGTMFWVRSALFEAFFRSHPPLLVREQLEDGNVYDDVGPTHTHAWERFLSWLVTAMGYQIRGI